MTIIDLNDSINCPQQLQFEASYPKYNGTGQVYMSYAGYRRYLITGKKCIHYLTMNSALVESTAKFIYVADLQDQLKELLTLEISKYPMLKLKLNKKTFIVWGGIPTPAQSEWLEIVRAVIKTL